ncbi:MAG: EF-hand domain-containing protein, partial [SAR324 cluster bacterium]|nr:EF-hand domain-containing protein [SAR324 cluster bacterium]
ENLPEVKEMMPRYPDEDVVKSNITGFFDEFIVLVDKDGSGKIDVDEFRPVWDIMRDAGLTNAQLPTSKELWNPLEEISARNSRGSARAINFIELLKKSAWTDPLRCRVPSAGKRFVNVLWNSNKFGSIVCTNGDPIRMFLDLTEDAAQKLEVSEHGELVTLADPSHYGTGDYEVNIDFILSSSNPEQLMIQLLEVTTQNLTKSKTRRKGN